MAKSNVVHLKQHGRGGWEETRGKLYKAIMAGREFKASNMRADRDHGAGFGGFTDQLPQEWSEVFRQDAPDYVVYSYNTPIAWHVPNDSDGDDERWVIPDVRYSVTTSRHQNLVRTALVFDKSDYIERVEDA